MQPPVVDAADVLLVRLCYETPRHERRERDMPRAACHVHDARGAVSRSRDAPGEHLLRRPQVVAPIATNLGGPRSVLSPESVHHM